MQDRPISDSESYNTIVKHSLTLLVLNDVHTYCVHASMHTQVRSGQNSRACILLRNTAVTVIVYA